MSANRFNNWQLRELCETPQMRPQLEILGDRRTVRIAKFLGAWIPAELQLRGAVMEYFRVGSTTSAWTFTERARIAAKRIKRERILADDDSLARDLIFNQAALYKLSTLEQLECVKADYVEAREYPMGTTIGIVPTPTMKLRLPGNWPADTDRQTLYLFYPENGYGSDYEGDKDYTGPRVFTGDELVPTNTYIGMVRTRSLIAVGRAISGIAEVGTQLGVDMIDGAISDFKAAERIIIP